MAGIPGNGRPSNGRTQLAEAPPTQAPEPAPWFPAGVHPAMAPQTLPCQSWVDQVPLPDGKIGVLIRLVTPAGVWINVVPGDFAGQLGAQLSQAAMAARSNLIVPGP